MKKILNLTFLTLILLSSCKKNDDSAPAAPAPVIYSEENPLPTFLSITGFNETNVVVTGLPPVEFGFTFKPRVKGKINSLVVKVPSTQSAVRITIWDKATQTALLTETIAVTANVEASKPITALALVKDKEYVISCNSNGWFTRQKSNTQAANFPVTAGNVIIANTNFQLGSSQTFPPPSISNNAYTGDISFNFQQTE
jgi:hypothetical protein